MYQKARRGELSSLANTANVGSAFLGRVLGKQEQTTGGKKIEGPRTGSCVTFQSSAGKTVEFRVNEIRMLDFLVEGDIKVTNLTSLETKGDSALYLSGTATGDFSSDRVTRPAAGEDPAVVDRALLLFERLGLSIVEID